MNIFANLYNESFMRKSFKQTYIKKGFFLWKMAYCNRFLHLLQHFAPKSETWRYKYWIKCNDYRFYGKVLNAEVLATSVLEHFDSTTLINKKTNSDKSRIRNTFLHFAPENDRWCILRILDYGGRFFCTRHMPSYKVLTKFVDMFSFVLLFAGKKTCLSFVNCCFFC